MAAGRLIDRAAAFGIEAHEIDGQDVLAVNKVSQQLVARARNGEGPFFMLLNTYRYHGHHVGDINRTYYRSKQEEQHWKDTRDPIVNFGAWLVAEKLASSEELQTMQTDIKAEAKAAVEYALNAAYPAAEDVTKHVFVETA